MNTSAVEFIQTGLSALESALHDSKSDLRNIQLATLSPQGHPGLRTLVLRGFERAQACAEMHTDARAGKARDIARDGRVSLLAWSAADHLQLRFEGSARLHRADDVARARWDTLSSNARSAYGLRTEPGSLLPEPADQSHLSPNEQFQQFTVILVSLTSVDALLLGPEGRQTRAYGRFTPATIDADWIGP